MPGENPTNTARFKVEVDGLGEMTQADPQGIESIHVEDHVDMIGVCQITFGATGGIAWDSVESGKEVKVSVGGSETVLFQGNITALRHSFHHNQDTLTLVASDPLYKMASSRATKIYEELKDSEIVSQVLSEASCDPGEIEPTEESRLYTFQRAESHYSFLRRLAARNGFLLRSREGLIDFAKPQYQGAIIEIAKEHLVNFDYTFTGRTLPQNLTVIGWDYLTKARIEGPATSGDVDTIGSGTNAVGETSIWGGDSHVSDVWVATQTGAKALARAELNRLARGFLRGRALTEGDGQLRANTLVHFVGHQEGFNPTAYVLSSRHRISVGEGFKTEIVFCSNTFPEG